MKYEIKYDKPGRLRVRSGPYAFSEQQGYAIAMMLRQNTWVETVEANHKNGSLLIGYRNGGREAVLELVKKLSVKSLPDVEPDEEDAAYQMTNDFVTGLMMSTGGFIGRKLIPMGLRKYWILLGAVGYVTKGLKALWQGKINVDVLDAASISAALYQKSYGTAGSVMFLLDVSSRLEEYTEKRTHNALARSLTIQADRVWLVTETGDVQIPVADLKVHDAIRIRQGNMIPVDGIVQSGEASVNEASITGEPMAAEKRHGAPVYAGTVVEEGSVVVTVTALSNESRIAQIMDLIDHSELLKADVQSKAEHLADALVPYSFLGSLAVLAFTGNINKALSVLMVDYSCAIKLSTPIAIISALKEASDHGMLIKGGKFFEVVANADTIIFDKTGTLTEASPKLASVISFGKYTDEEILRTAACLEEHFPHSVARAIVNAAAEQGLKHEEEHAEVEYVVAHGISSYLNGKRCLIGSYHFIAEDEKIRISHAAMERIREQARGDSVIYLAIGKTLAGALLINDPPRAEAAEVINRLKQEGITNIVMLTGDGELAAKATAEMLGITEYHAQVLPQDKHAYVEQMQREGHKVIMVGDGINDSPALAAADVSIAMRDATDLAREVADVTLLNSTLDKLVHLRRLSIKMLQRIESRYRFIIGFNSGLLAGGLFGILSPGTSAYLHNFSTMAISACSMQPCLKEAEWTINKAEVFPCE